MAERTHLSSTALSGSAASAPALDVAPQRSSEEIRQHIAATRDSISETVDELSSRVQRTFEWRTYVAEYPLAATGVAAGLGLFVGYLMRPRPTPGERIHDALADLIEDVVARVQTQFDSLGVLRPGLSQTLRATLMATLLKAGSDFARTKLMAKAGSQDQEQDQEKEDAGSLSEPDELPDDVETTDYHVLRHPLSH